MFGRGLTCGPASRADFSVPLVRVGSPDSKPTVVDTKKKRQPPESIVLYTKFLLVYRFTKIINIVDNQNIKENFTTRHFTNCYLFVNIKTIQEKINPNSNNKAQ
ncbi:hypothetical protein GCM10028816_45590 [Spirosoma lituiforme]